MIPQAGLLNGITTLNRRTVLAADSFRGLVWAIDVLTGASRILLSDPLMAPLAPPLSNPPADNATGIDGIKIRGHTLYFTNFAQAILAKIDIHPDGSARGAAQVVAHAPPGMSYDDFVFDARGDTFLATGRGNSIDEVGRAGRPQVIVAGDINSTTIAEPTAAQFGRTLADRKVLYVTTAGGLNSPVNGNEVVGGQLVAVDTRRSWRAEQ